MSLFSKKLTVAQRQAIQDQYLQQVALQGALAQQAPTPSPLAGAGLYLSAGLANQLTTPTPGVLLSSGVGAFSSGATSGFFPAMPQEMATDREVRWAHGPYSVGVEGGYYYLSRIARDLQGMRQRLDLYAGRQPPSRALVAAVIRWDRGHRPAVNARDAYGSLMGVRYFRLTDDLRLQSPVQMTVWERAVMTVPEWDESGAVRGTVGIHAAWPAMGRSALPWVDLDETDSRVLARVRGQGKVVIGRQGWRAETVIVDTVYLTHALMSPSRLRRLESLYPSISFEGESWTLERSSKSAMSSRPHSR